MALLEYPYQEVAAQAQTERESRLGMSGQEYEHPRERCGEKPAPVFFAEQEFHPEQQRRHPYRNVGQRPMAPKQVIAAGHPGHREEACQGRA